MKALDQYDQIIRLKPNEPDGYALRGSLLINLRAYDRAVKALNRALKLDPNKPSEISPTKLTLYAFGQMNSSRPEGCWRQRWPQRRRPSKPIRKRSRPCSEGAVLAGLHRFDRALAAFDQALQVDPSYLWALKEKTKALYPSGPL